MSQITSNTNNAFSQLMLNVTSTHLLPIPQLLSILVYDLSINSTLTLIRLSLQSLHGSPLNVCAAYTHDFKILFFFNTYACLVHSVQDYYILLKRNGSLIKQMLFTHSNQTFRVHSRRRVNTNSMRFHPHTY